MELRAQLELAAAPAEGSLPKIRIDLYSGGLMTPMGFGTPVLLNLKGIKFAPSLPILLNHDPSQIVGHATSTSTDGRVVVEGVVSGASQAAETFVASAKNGFPWQASIGASPTKPPQFVPRDSTIEANGRRYTGPLWFYTEVMCREATVTAVGADANTAAKVAARANQLGGQDMPNDINGQTPETASGNTPSAPTNPGQVAASAGTTTPASPPAPAVQAAPAAPAAPAVDLQAEYRKMRAAELEHEQKIRAAARGDEALVVRAIRDGMTIDAVRAEAAESALTAAAGPAPAVHTGAANVNQFSVIQAASLMSMGVDSKYIEASYPEPVLEAAGHRRSIGLVETIQLAAAASGRPIHAHYKSEEFLRAALATHEITQVLSGTIRGAMLAAYRAMDPVWRKFCRVGRNESFNPEKRFRLAGEGMGRVRDTGELPSIKLHDAEYQSEVETKGGVLYLTRRDIINDNWVAFQQIPQMAGRQAAFLILESVAEALNDAGGDFFKVGNGNIATGATHALAHDTLGNQVQAFSMQTGIDGKILGYEAKYLIVPTALKMLAQRLYKSSLLVATGVGNTAKLAASSNEHEGMYEPVSFPQIGAGQVAGGSDTAYFLAPDPANAAAIEVSFLRGVQEPTVQQVDVQPGFLGRAWNLYIDFGVSYLEPAAMRKVTGAD